MKERGWGRIISVATCGVEQPIPNLALSNGIRSALIGRSKTLANEIITSGRMISGMVLKY
jgi:3-oxoacyl-[acyl-carrier protein] reductase